MEQQEQPIEIDQEALNDVLMRRLSSAQNEAIKLEAVLTKAMELNKTYEAELSKLRTEVNELKNETN